MNISLRHLMPLLVLQLLPLLAWAASPAVGRYQLVVNGVTTVLELRDDGSALRGELQEGPVRIPVRGQLKAKQLKLQLSDPTLGLAIGSFEGTLSKTGIDGILMMINPNGGKSEQRHAVFVREGVANTPPIAAAAAGARDARLTGSWLHEELINSSGGAGGFASFATRRTMVLESSGRAQQWLESASSGGNWSTDASRKMEFTGEWKTEGSSLMLRPDGQTAFVPAGNYRFSGEYLVLEAKGKRFILKRR